MINRYFDKTEPSYIKLNIICALLTIVIFSIDIQLPLGVAGGVPYIAIILIALWSSRPNLVIYLAAICSIMTLLGFFYHQLAVNCGR